MTTLSNDRILTVAHHDFARGLFRYANLKVHDTMLSDDLVQLTFIKTWLYLQKNGEIDLMRAFLYHILNRLIIDEYRRKKTVSLDLLSEEGRELEVANSENILNFLDKDALMSLIEKLPEMYRDAIKMRHAQELSLVEMSVITHKSPNTMSMQVHRGLAKLKVLYLGSTT